MSVTALLLCAGRGERLGAGVDKALVGLAGRPLFLHALESLQRSAPIDDLVVVGPVTRLREAHARAAGSPGKIVAWCEGGRERQDSVALGLRHLPERCRWIAVHDAARALIGSDVIARVVEEARRHGAAIAAVPLADTLKRAAGERVTETLPRAGLWRAQTPQVFRREWLEEAHARAAGTGTDDAALVEALGHPVRLTAGDPVNFKITTPQDLELAEAWLTRSSTNA